MSSFNKLVYNLKYNWSIHSYLIIVYFLLSTINNYFDEKEITSNDLLEVVFLFIISMILVRLFQKRLENNQGYVVLFSLTLCLCLFYSNLVNLNGRTTFNALIVPIEILAAYLVFFYYRKMISTHWKIRFYLNCYFTILCLTELFILSTNKLNFINTEKKTTFSDSKVTKTDQILNSKDNPNVYILFYDGYANEKNLRNYFNFDNSLFIKKIRSKGFYYIPNSHSNYDQTVKTWASFLNLDYLKTDKETELLANIKFNVATEHIFQKAYNIVNLSPFQIGEKKNLNSYDLMFGSKSLVNHLYKRTIFFKIERFFKYHILGYRVENNKLDLLRNVINVIPNDKSNLILYHSMITHYPFQFDENGKHQVKLLLHGVQQRMQDYIVQIKYTNKLIMQTINSILLKQPNSIIILASDHGYRKIEGQPLKIVKQESFDNFCAFYFPDKKYEMLYDSVSIVNILKIVTSKIKKNTLSVVKDIKFKTKVPVKL